VRLNDTNPFSSPGRSQDEKTAPSGGARPRGSGPCEAGERGGPFLRAAVRMDRLRQPSRWEEWRFNIAEVVIDEGAFGSERRVLRDDGHCTQWLFPDLPVMLHHDEAEGYYLNLSSGSPVWFVMWRVDHADPSQAWPEIVTLSYNEAGRWLDAQERVDNVPLDAGVRAALQDFVDANYRPEPKKRKRPASFVAPEDRG